MGISAVNSTFKSSIPENADILVAVVYSIFGICSLFGNSTLLYVSYKKKHLLKPAEFFIINLAISDLGMTVTLYPLAITSSISHRKEQLIWANCALLYLWCCVVDLLLQNDCQTSPRRVLYFCGGGRWLYGKTMCLIYAFCGVLFGICSLSTLTLLSIVCCMKVCYPLYGNRFTLDHGRLLIACAWAYALLFACSPLAHWGEYGPEPYGTACCIDWKSSNTDPVAKSYTVVLFVFCFILPCGIIIASYSQILITVKESRKAVEQHVSTPTRMGNIQTIIVKLSVAVCIGFFTAWSPYALVSMWAAFGSIENIPPLAFAIPAVFAKSSTLYNPIIYLLLKPNFRNFVCKDCGILQHISSRNCLCIRSLQKCHYRSVIEISLKSLKRRTGSSAPSAQLGQECSKCTCEKCDNTFECFKNYPKSCQVSVNTVQFSLQESTSPEPKQQPKMRQTSKKSVRVIVRGKKSSEIDSLEITLETVPAHSKAATP